MTSPLAPFANATVTITVYGNALAAADSTTGNIVPITETVTFRAFLKAAATRRVSLPGVDQFAQQLTGYAVEPLDSRIRPGQRGTIALDGEPEGDCTIVALRGPFGAGGIGATLKQVLGESIILERVFHA